MSAPSRSDRSQSVRSMLFEFAFLTLGIPHSSDLWVTGSVPGTTDLGKHVSLSYAVGTAAGPYIFCDMMRILS